MATSDHKNSADRTADASARKASLWIIAALIVGVAAVVATAYLRTGEKGSIPTNFAAEKLIIHKITSEQIQSWIAAEMKKSGAKVGVVNIWATWCEPCRAEMPEFAKFQKTGSAPVFLISADNELDEPIVRSFLIEKGVSFETSLIAGDQQKFVETWQTLSNPEPAKQWAMSLPATFLVDASGKVKSFTIGEINTAELSGLVKKALEVRLDTAHD
ncbi:hypothetical protein BH10BDE1_BH10BDE1_34740 [soil metagenome]